MSLRFRLNIYYVDIVSEKHKNYNKTKKCLAHNMQSKHISIDAECLNSVSYGFTFTFLKKAE